ncbi:hypothetical protein ACSDR0_45555 [Streptosporangium sp. G11]|uniref:hypothetical protein n=1 Tax=Streptosporangium sp. G11 TaxID=3436926 RepID=UPI003EC0E92A
MSFGNFARKARDTALPHQRRLSALRSCVQLYRPIGFEATLSFLQAKAGPFRTDEAALLRALAVLEASRSAWQEEKLAYAAARREAKQRGQRSPRPDDINPYTPTHWYGARREAALHTVSFWYRGLRNIGTKSNAKPYRPRSAHYGGLPASGRHGQGSRT